MQPFDWLVVASYLLAMLGIGAYFALQTRSQEDYLLGGRAMKASTVGLSLFATLFSTNSYLSYPAEAALNGPVAASMIFSCPLVYVIVGYGLIPYFMRLPITSAYEILELRFGPDVRMLGAVIFLFLRLLWMGTIIYATTDKVLMPLLGESILELPFVNTLTLCIGMSLLTIAYTAMGGLRAVVLSDAIQSLLLLAGAVLTFVMATYAIGGTSQLFSSELAQQWGTVDFSFNINVRTTLSIVILSQLVWWICTCGSDQMAVQRYLATENQRTARKMLATSLISSIATVVMLTLVGLALGAYYRQNPDQLVPHSVTTSEGANIAFSTFILNGLPIGITGAIVAGLLAAAMSSLSSGFNSSSLVITVDFLDRFAKDKSADSRKSPLRTQAVTVAVGLLTILVSLAVAKYGEGENLFDLVINNSNVLVTPLFILFFMALFVPWATRLGAWSGAIAAAYIAIRLGFFRDFGFGGLWAKEHALTFWMMPVSLVVGTVVGCLVSLLPISKRRPMLELKPLSTDE